MGIVKAYVDGSYNKKEGIGGFGIVYLDENNMVVSLDSGTIKNKGILSMWNVGAEITASLTVLEKCLYEKIPSIEIYYDYEGIEKWATQTWKRKNEYTKKYSEVCELISKDVRVHFVHVSGHSGDKYNDLADILAKIGSHTTKNIDEMDGNKIRKNIKGYILKEK